MKSNFLLLGISLSFIALLSACGSANQIGAQTQSDVTTASLTETYWKVTRIDGTAVEMAADQAREKHFILKNTGTQVIGFSGCNRFFGQFTSKMKNSSEGSLRFENLGSTKMACPNVDFNEQQLLTVFSNTTHYQITGESLSLLDKNSETLATFESIYFQ